MVLYKQGNRKEAPYKQRNRNEYDIIASMLKASSRGAARTHIMYRANLSFKLLNEYLDSLIQSGLLEYEVDGRKTVYFPSKQGFDFLENYRRIKMLYRKKLRRTPVWRNSINSKK